MSNFVNLLDIVYPVGSIYQSMNETSPADVIGGTWTQIKTFLYGADTAKETGGEATHTLTIDEMPSRTHMALLLLLLTVEMQQRIVFFLQLILLHGIMVIQIGIMNQRILVMGQHTTTCRPIRPASFGIEQLKLFKGNLYIL